MVFRRLPIIIVVGLNYNQTLQFSITLSDLTTHREVSRFLTRLSDGKKRDQTPLRRSPGRANSDRPSDLRSLRDVVKRLPNWLKIGVQAGFGPNFTMEFEAEIPKKFGLA